ncbi:MAG: excinuclease ABC subunit UvrC [Myxococcales bacterium]|nr:excinuclease ABC subunit UvrC [Myxococcales bacterium]
MLENNLIKRYRPRFNVKLRDDKQYLVLRIDPAARWPRFELVRRTTEDRARHFGPYHSAQSARRTLRALNRHFRLRTCSDFTLDHRARPCLQHQIGRCPAPCVLTVDEAEYAEQVQGAILFLEGRHGELTKTLRERMQAAAKALEFETAARLRDQLEAIDKSLEHQRVVGDPGVDQDVIGFYREGGQVEFVLLHVRNGKLLGTRGHSLRGMELPDAEVLASFLAAYYEDAPTLPDEVLLPIALVEDDGAPLSAWLSERAGRKVAVKVPIRGERARLVRLARRNAASNFVTRRSQHQDHEAALARVQQRFKLSKSPRIIECYDISHIQGSDPVASMVVFVDGAPAPRRYRSFKIKGKAPAAGEPDRHNDDFASMYEVLTRRLRRALEGGKDEAPRDDEDDDDRDPWALPDLLVIDGGKGQLHRALAAMQDLGVPLGAAGVDVISLAKERWIEPGKEAAEKETAKKEGELRPERVFLPGVKDPIRMRPGSSEHFILTRLRDEAHRFAITFHRKRRGKRALHSALDDIKGVGPSLKKALLAHFGTVAAIRAADLAALQEVPGVGAKVAARIHAALVDQ